MTQMLGLFKEAEGAATATEALEQAGYGSDNFDVLTGSPYPEGAFGERETHHRLYIFPLIGALLGFSTAILLTVGTQLAYPLVAGSRSWHCRQCSLSPMRGRCWGRYCSRFWGSSLSRASRISSRASTTRESLRVTLE